MFINATDNQTANFNILNRPLLIFACLYPRIWKSGGTKIFFELYATFKSAASPMRGDEGKGKSIRGEGREEKGAERRPFW